MVTMALFALKLEHCLVYTCGHESSGHNQLQKAHQTENPPLFKEHSLLCLELRPISAIAAFRQLTENHGWKPI